MSEQIKISDKPFVGVFDSGLGGISVLAELINKMPHMDFAYFGDSANAPYGTKNPDFVIARAEEICSNFVYRGARAIVIACNTATSVAAGKLREKYRIPIIGMEPAVKPALAYLEEQRANKKIAVLATPMTLKENKYRQLVRTLNAESKVVEIPSPELVELVEGSFFHEEKVRKMIAAYIRNRIDTVSDIGAIVLGCTHFVFLKKYFEEYCEGLKVFDGNAGTANRLSELLKNADEEENFSRNNERGQVHIDNSAGAEKIELSKKLLWHELNKEEYSLVEGEIQRFVGAELNEEEAELAKLYYTEKMSIHQIARQTGKKERQLQDIFHAMNARLFRHLKKTDTK
ncbi:MAG: glutamate racemase [Bacillota bacterium]|nr:glutamate racemase [Bacillota bacterium]